MSLLLVQRTLVLNVHVVWLNTFDAPIAIIDYAQDDSDRNEGHIIGDVEGKRLS